MGTLNHKIENKTAALVLLLAIALSIASCSDKGSKTKVAKVSADSAWYDSEIIDFKLTTKANKRLTSLTHSIAGIDDKYIAVFSDGSYFVKAWTDDVEYKDWLIKIVTFIDRTTKQTVKTVDIVNILGKWHSWRNGSSCNAYWPKLDADGMVTYQFQCKSGGNNKVVLAKLRQNGPNVEIQAIKAGRVLVATYPVGTDLTDVTLTSASLATSTRQSAST